MSKSYNLKIRRVWNDNISYEILFHFTTWVKKFWLQFFTKDCLFVETILYFFPGTLKCITRLCFVLYGRAQIVLCKFSFDHRLLNKSHTCYREIVYSVWTKGRLFFQKALLFKIFFNFKICVQRGRGRNSIAISTFVFNITNKCQRLSVNLQRGGFSKNKKKYFFKEWWWILVLPIYL